MQSSWLWRSQCGRVARAFIVLAAAGVASCATSDGAPETQDGTSRTESRVLLTEDELSEQLDAFADYFALTIQRAARGIQTATSDPEVQRAAMVWRLQAIRTIRGAILVEDPQLGLLDAWVFCVQMRDYFGTNEAQAYLGAGHDDALAAARTVEAQIVGLGALFLKDEELERARTHVEQFADANPLEGKFARPAMLPSASTSKERSTLEWIVSIPMAPFRVFSGIDAGAAAIRQFSSVSSRFARRFEGLPQETLWEMQILLHDLEQRPTVQTFADSSARIATTAEDLAATAKSLPADVRAELEQALDTVDTKQEGLRGTLASARETIGAAGEVVERTQRVVQDVDGMTASLEKTSAGLAEAGSAWKGAVTAYHEMVADLYPREEEPAATAEDDEPFDILDYARTAHDIGGAAKELRLTITELHGLLRGDALDTGIARAEQTARAAAEAASESGVDLVDHATWRALQILLAAFVLAAIYRAGTNRWLSRTAER